jgi:hypothetical protein
VRRPLQPAVEPGEVGLGEYAVDWNSGSPVAVVRQLLATK